MNDTTYPQYKRNTVAVPVSPPKPSGHLKSSQPGAPVPVDEDGENMAVRAFLMLYGEPALTVGQMKKHMGMSGFKSWPVWVDTEPDGAHLTKGGAQLWIRHLFAHEDSPRLSERAVTPPAQANVSLKVRLVSYPESNGKRNWTAMFSRTEPWGGLIGSSGGITIGRGECWNRVAYEAERARFLLGERSTEPCILAYGDDVKTPEEWRGDDSESAFCVAQGGAS